MSLPAIQENDTISLENVISVKKFPPKLRKLAKYLLESDKPVSFNQACKDLNLNVDSIYVQMSQCKKKGNDFQQFLNQQSEYILHRNKVNILRALVDGAVQDSHMDRKLYFQLTGDLKETTNINIGTLTVGVNVSALPVQDNRDRGVIDVQPFIPKGK